MQRIGPSTWASIKDTIQPIVIANNFQLFKFKNLPNIPSKMNLMIFVALKKVTAKIFSTVIKFQLPTEN